MGEGKSDFFNEVTMVKSITLQGWPQAQESSTKTNWTQCSLFCFLKSEKEHVYGCARGSRRNLGEKDI